MKIQLHDHAILHKGDCLQELKTVAEASVDLVLTDPPYGMAFKSGYRSVETTHRPIANDDQLDWLPELVRELYACSN